MKFKRLAAFVLTAALSVSSAGISVFAAEVTLNDSLDLHERVATITVKYAYTDLTDDGNGNYKKNSDDKNELNTQFNNMDGYKKLSNTDLYEFLYWTTKQVNSDSEYDSIKDADDAVSKGYKRINGNTFLGKIANEKGLSTLDAGQKIKLYPVYRRWASQREKDEYEAKKAAENKANDDATRWINKRNNVVGSLQKKNEITKNNAHKLPTTKDPKGKIETKQVSVSPKNNHGADGVNTSTYNYSPTDMKNIKDYLKIADTDLYFVYDAEYPSGYELIPGKQAIVTFNVRYDKDADGNKDKDGNNLTSKELNYDLTDSRVYLYRITQTGKVKVTDITKGKNYVSTITDQFGLYILVVAPKGASAMGYDNPPTGEGDVLPVAMLAVSAIGASCLLTVKKRKEIEA